MSRIAPYFSLSHGVPRVDDRRVGSLDVVYEPEIVCICQPCDRSKLTRLSEDVTEVLEKIPARLKVTRHVRPRYACRQCEGVFQAPAPDLPIERGRLGPGLRSCPWTWCRRSLTGLP